jgi:hypothetical protein
MAQGSMMVDLEYLSMILDVDFDEEPELKPFLQQMVMLPIGWLFTPHHTFLELASGNEISQHPAEEILAQLVKKKRAELRGDMMVEALSVTKVEGGASVESTVLQMPWLDIAAPPPIMVLRAWFNEGSTTRSTLIRRELKLEYDTQECYFKVYIQDSDKIYQVSHILDKKGRALNHFDLRVGAKLNILGKMTTFMQANLVTSQWIEKQARHFERLTGSLTAEMRKYNLKMAAVSAVTPPAVFRSGDNPASHDLRQMMNKLEALFLEFHKIRPAAANAWGERAVKISKAIAAQQESKDNNNQSRGSNSRQQYQSSRQESKEEETMTHQQILEEDANEEM